MNETSKKHSKLLLEFLKKCNKKAEMTMKDERQS